MALEGGRYDRCAASQLPAVCRYCRRELPLAATCRCPVAAWAGHSWIAHQGAGGATEVLIGPRAGSNLSLGQVSVSDGATSPGPEAGMATRPISPMVEEQDALRRLAMLVAEGAQPDEVFAAVVAEAGRLVGGDYTVLARRDQDDAITFVSAWTPTGMSAPPSVGNRFPLGGHNVSTMVCRTGRPARIDQGRITGAMADVVVDRWGVRSSVGVPIIIGGRVWGVMIGASTRRPLPSQTETRLSRFTELVATALANAQARVELRDYADEQSALRQVATLVAR